MKKPDGGLRGAWRYAAALAGLGLLWAAAAAVLDGRTLPAPLAVSRYFWGALRTAEFWGHVAASSGRVAAGLGLGFIVAFPAGLLLGADQRLDAWLSPALFLTYPAPKIIFLPALLAALGLGEAPKIIIIALTAGYQILLIVRDGVRRLNPAYAAVFKTLLPRRGGRGESLSLAVHVLIPAVLPEAATALRLASGTAVAVLFMAESFVSERGLGFMIIDAWGGLDLPRMFSGILAMSFLGLGLHELCGFWERRLRRWAPDIR